MSCALNELNSQTAQMEYVACFMIVYSQNKYNVKEFGELVSFNYTIVSRFIYYSIN